MKDKNFIEGTELQGKLQEGYIGKHILVNTAEKHRDNISSLQGVEAHKVQENNRNTQRQ